MSSLLDDTRLRTDFYGNIVRVHWRELPLGIKWYGRRFLNELMPYEGIDAGMELINYPPTSVPDPVCLYDRWGKIIKQWPDDYMPDREEVRQAVMEELYKEGRVNV
jgi:hypothetical protein